MCVSTQNMCVGPVGARLPVQPIQPVIGCCVSAGCCLHSSWLFRSADESTDLQLCPLTPEVQDRGRRTPVSSGDSQEVLAPLLSRPPLSSRAEADLAVMVPHWRNLLQQ